MTQLWHYTCLHGHHKLASGGLLMPGVDLMNPAVRGQAGPTSRYVWMTDLSVPVRDALGLTMEHIRCDRTAHRYRVTQRGIAIRWSDLRRSFDPEWRELLEASPGARPMHWWVAQEPVPCVYDPVEVASTA
jgi:hypothetical protein